MKRVWKFLSRVAVGLGLLLGITTVVVLGTVVIEHWPYARSEPALVLALVLAMSYIVGSVILD